MQVKRIKIIADIHALWPHLVDGLPNPTNLAIPDSEYWLPCIEEVKNLLHGTFLERYKYTLEGFDCDDYAKVFAAFITQERYIRMRRQGEKEWYQWAAGEVWGTRFEGRDCGHALGIVDTIQGVHIIEVQNDKVWPATADGDRPHLIKL